MSLTARVCSWIQSFHILIKKKGCEPECHSLGRLDHSFETLITGVAGRTVHTDSIYGNLKARRRQSKGKSHCYISDLHDGKSSMTRNLPKIPVKHWPNLFTPLEGTLGESKRVTACMSCFQSHHNLIGARLAHPIYTSIATQNAPSSLGRAPCQSKKGLLNRNVKYIQTPSLHLSFLLSPSQSYLPCTWALAGPWPTLRTTCPLY